MSHIGWTRYLISNQHETNELKINETNNKICLIVLYINKKRDHFYSVILMNNLRKKDFILSFIQERFHTIIEIPSLKSELESTQGIKLLWKFLV